MVRRSALSLALVALVVTLELAVTASSARADFALVDPRPTGVSLTGVYGVKGSVFVVGRVGTALVTHDGGATWKPLAIKTTENLEGIWGIDRDIYVAASGDQIFVSHDAGTTWAAVQPLPHAAGLRFRACWGATARDVTCVGADGTIIHTIDRGASWLLDNADPARPRASWRAIAGTPDGKRIYAVGDGGAIAARTDGAWHKLDATVTDDLRGVAAVGTRFVAVGDLGRLIALDDAGAHPTRRGTTELDAIWSDGASAFVVGRSGNVVGVKAHRDSTTIMHTTDGGATWTSIDSELHEAAAAIWSDKTAYWGVGQYGEIIRSTDGGATWASMTSRATHHDDVRTIVGGASGAGGTGGTGDRKGAGRRRVRHHSIGRCRCDVDRGHARLRRAHRRAARRRARDRPAARAQVHRRRRDVDAALDVARWRQSA